jgi:O-acetyl-ADP-ribose deacetylase (regulator of RNase III)
MSIETRYADLLSVEDGLLVHGCNAQGVMGAGLALALRTRYPKIYNDYLHLLRARETASPLGHVVFTCCTPTLTIASGVTQEHYGRQKTTQYTSYAALKKVFETVNTYALAQPTPPEICFGKIGAGLGNGKWEDIVNIIQTTMHPSLTLALYIPSR